MRRKRTPLWMWWRWLKNGRPRWCSGAPRLSHGLHACGCSWDVGRVVWQCPRHERMARAAGLVLRDGDLRKEGL